MIQLLENRAATLNNGSRVDGSRYPIDSAETRIYSLVGTNTDVCHRDSPPALNCETGVRTKQNNRDCKNSVLIRSGILNKSVSIKWHTYQY